MWLLFGALACRTNVESKPVEENIIPQELSIVATLEIDETARLNGVNAGTAIPYTLTVTDAYGVPLESDFTWEMSDSLEELFVTQSHIQPVVSGMHSVTATVWAEDPNYPDNPPVENFSTVEFEVLPSDVARVDLQLDDFIVTAGQNIGFSTMAFDRYGNEVEDLDIDVFSDETELQFQGRQMYSTIAGFYAVQAAYEELSDIEYIEVIPGEPSFVDLSILDSNIELFESVQCFIEIQDEYGNNCDLPWTLSVLGTGNTVISNDIVTFYDEGTYNLSVEVDGTNLSDSYGPILIDSSGPTLTIDNPPRADWVTDSSTIVEGNVVEPYSQLLEVLVDNTVVSVDNNGDFTHSMSLGDGINMIVSEALDSDGNLSNDSRAVLSGDFHPRNQGLDDGISIYMGSAGIDILENYALQSIGSLNLGSLLPSNPVAQTSLGWCGVNVNLHNLTNGPLSINIDPQSNGYIVLTLTLNSINVDVDINTSGWGCPDVSGHVSASSVVATVTIDPDVTNYVTHMNVVSSNSSLNNLNVSLNGLASLLNFIVDIFEGDIADMLESEVQSALEDEVPPLMEEVFQGLEFSESFDVGSATYTLNAFPSSIYADNNGIGIGMFTNIQSDTWILADDGLGSLVQNYPIPTFAGNSSVNMAISVDVLNQLLYQGWGGGLISQELNFSELGLSPDDIGLLFPNAVDLRLTVEPLLPPIAMIRNGQMQMEIGDLYIAIHNGDYALGDVRLEVYASIFAPLNVQASGDYLSASVGTPTSIFDVVYPELGVRGTESLLQALIPLLMPSLTDALGQIPVPSFNGITLTNLNSSINSGHIAVSGDASL